MRKPLRFISLTMLLAFAAVTIWQQPLLAQESRGTITGKVSDGSGGVVPGASVQVLSKAQGTRLALTTNESGLYQAPYLAPGPYQITIEKQGFKKYVREDVELRVNDRLELNVVLEVGAQAETITITAETPLLDTASASTGQVVGSDLISQLPLGDGTAYSLIRLAPGTTFTGGYALQRPMDNGNLAGIQVGSAGRSEFTLDGASNSIVVGGNASLGISPPADSIQEFKVQTTGYDAQLGHTGAGSVDLALKSGGNSFHGAAYYYNRSGNRAANDFTSNSLGRDRPARDYFRTGATVTGPIVKNKTFFMGSYEKLQDDQVEPVQFTVPNDAMRTGDFSGLLAANIKVYDPLSATLSGTKVVRQPFSGNIIPPNRQDQVALKMLSYWPKANQSPLADGVTNNYSYIQPWLYHYNLQMAKVDHLFSPNHRVFVRFTRNWRVEERYNWAGVQNGYAGTEGIDNRRNWNGAIGYTAMLSATTVFDMKANGLKFNSDIRPAETFDNSKLGFPSATLAYMRGFQYFPAASFLLSGSQNYGSSNSTIGRGSPTITPFYNYNFSSTLTKIIGPHTIKVGYDLRLERQNFLGEGNKGGTYSFNDSYVKPDNSAAGGQLGLGLAEFLLGIPTGGQFDTTASYAIQVPAHAIFIQDDWRVNSRLTMNLGLRYDLEPGMTERYNRMVRGFDVASASPIQAAAQAAYAKAPDTNANGLAVSDFKVLGGYTFASSDNRGVWNPDKHNFQPRGGVAFKLTDKTVLRGGAGLFVEPFQTMSAISQTGFSRPTLLNITGDSGLTFNSSLTNPFASGTQLLVPLGSSQGLATSIGSGPGTIFPVDGRKNAQYWHFSFGVQRELPHSILVEATYLGMRGQNIQITRSVNSTFQKYYSTMNVRDTTNESFLSGVITNPFKGLTPDTPGLNGSTVGRATLLKAYPGFGSMNVASYEGTNRYDSVMFRVEKRMSKGLMVLGTYTYSRTTEQTSPLNWWGPLDDRVSPSDRPHHFVAAFVAQLPFGKNHKWGSNWNRVVDGILGGWELSNNYNYQTGMPFTWGNGYYDPSRDPKDLRTYWGEVDGRKPGIDFPAFDLTGFYFHDAAVQKNGADNIALQAADSRINIGTNVRTFPSVLPNVREQNHHSMDSGLAKTLRLTERFRVQVRADAINALNYTLFRAARFRNTPRNSDFGLFYDPGASTVVMRPRDVQLGVKLTF